MLNGVTSHSGIFTKSSCTVDRANNQLTHSSVSGRSADPSVRLQWLIYVYGSAQVFNSSVQATGSLSLSQIFIAAEWSGVCLDMAQYSRDATDAIRAFLAHRNAHDIRNRCCTWWGPSRDNNSASVHEYFRQLTAVLISKDMARLAKDPINLILNFRGDVVITLLKKWVRTHTRLMKCWLAKRRGSGFYRHIFIRWWKKISPSRLKSSKNIGLYRDEYALELQSTWVHIMSCKFWK